MDEYSDKVHSLPVKLTFNVPNVQKRVEKLWPRELKDQIAMSALLLLGPVIGLFELCVAVPYADSTNLYMHGLLALFLAINFYGNLYKLMTVDPSGGKHSLPAVMQPGFRFCSACGLNSPPRAYHCPTCNTCIWKRDHHCSFSGSCVGYFNHRYYLMCTAYAMAGLAFASWWNADYVSYMLGGYSPFTIWWLMIPHVAMILRFISFIQFLVIIFFMGTLTCFGVAAYLLGAQLFCILRGQTRPEFLLDIKTYNLGMPGNFLDIFGARWFLALIWPFAASQLPGNGLSFHCLVADRVNEQNTKNL